MWQGLVSDVGCLTSDAFKITNEAGAGPLEVPWLKPCQYLDESVPCGGRK